MRCTSLFTAGLGLLLASAAAPIALADPPGYYFQDLPPSSANASSNASSIATDAQIAAANRKADQALMTAQEALCEAQQALSSRESALALSAQTREHPRPIVDGHHVQPRRDDVCALLHRSPDCRKASANGVDNDLLQEILRNAAR